MKKDKNGEREKAKLLVLAVLYKIGASISLGSASVASLRELLFKSENLVAKFGLKYENTILEAINKRKHALATMEVNEKRSYDDIFSVISQKNVLKESNNSLNHAGKKSPKASMRNSTLRVPSTEKTRPKSFAIKKRSVETSKGRPINPLKSREGRTMAQTPDHRTNNAITTFYRSDTRADSKRITVKNIDSSFDSVKMAEQKGPGESKRNKQTIQKSVVVESQVELNKKAVFARRDFKEGLDSLLKLGEYVKNEIKELNEAPKSMFKVRTRAAAEQIFDENEEIKSDFLDREIALKMDMLLESQLEWQKQRTIFQEKLEKLEKNLERQTVAALDESNSVEKPKVQNGEEVTVLLLNAISPKETREIIKVNPEFLSPQKAKNPTKRSEQTRNLSIDIKRSNSKSESKSVLSEVSSIVGNASSLEGYRNALKYSLYHFKNGEYEFGVELKQIISGSTGDNYMIGFALIKNKTSCELPSIQLSIYPYLQASSNNTSPCQSSSLPLLSREIINFEELEFILKNIHAASALPNHKPAASFTNISFFLIHVLAKFIRVHDSPEEDKFQVSIQNAPRSLIPGDPIKVSFFGVEWDLGLIHLNEKTFRLFLKKNPDSAGLDTITCEVVLDDFVMGTFFEYCSKASVMLKQLFEEDSSPSHSDIEKFRMIVESSINCVWLQKDEQKKVV